MTSPFGPLEVLDEGPHHLVVNKPAGMVVVAGRGTPRPTLLDLVIERCGNGARPVHRLDLPTSGACAFAKSLFGQQALSDAFRRRLIDKRYVAVVEGAPTFHRLVIDARLLRVDDTAARRGPLSHQTVDEKGQQALTRVEVLARGTAYSVVMARPETGRMHQIRAHLAHVGHPLLGDAAYGAAVHPLFTKKRLPLHAYLLGLPIPSGGRRQVTAPVPADLAAFVVEAAERLAAECARFLAPKPSATKPPRAASKPVEGKPRPPIAGKPRPAKTPDARRHGKPAPGGPKVGPRTGPPPRTPSGRRSRRSSP